MLSYNSTRIISRGAVGEEQLEGVKKVIVVPDPAEKGCVPAETDVPAAVTNENEVSNGKNEVTNENEITRKENEIMHDENEITNDHEINNEIDVSAPDVAKLWGDPSILTVKIKLPLDIPRSERTQEMLLHIQM